MRRHRRNQIRRTVGPPRAALFAAMLMLAAPLTSAAPVPFVGSVPVTDGEIAAGDAIVAERTVPFLLLDARFDYAYDLTLHNFVVRSAATGTLDFFYRVTNNSDQPLRLIDMDTGPFTRPDSVDPIDVNLWDDASGAYAPLRADRQRSHFDGVSFQFPFFDALAAGESSRLFFVRTPATDFRLEGLTQFRSTPGYTTDNGFALTFNPVLDGPIIPPPQTAVVVPLPAGAWAAGLLTLACAVLRWRRPRPRII